MKIHYILYSLFITFLSLQAQEKEKVAATLATLQTLKNSTHNIFSLLDDTDFENLKRTDLHEGDTIRIFKWPTLDPHNQNNLIHFHMADYNITRQTDPYDAHYVLCTIQKSEATDSTITLIKLYQKFHGNLMAHEFSEKCPKQFKPYVKSKDA